MAATQIRSMHPATRRPRPVSEAGRERETFKYEPYLLSDFRRNDTGRLPASDDLATSSDSVMTALAQVGLYKTGTERAFISLFDTSHQYFVAEATPWTPLTASLPSRECPERLLFCGTAVPRSHGICEHALSSTVHPPSFARHRPGSAELPIVITTELASDPRFFRKTVSLLLSETLQYQFYAAVPIRTPAGIDIGTFCVVAPSQPSGWDDKSTQILRDVSGAITDHLLAKRSMQAHRRNERVNRGLGSFIEGKATLSGWRDGPNTAAYADNTKSDEGTLDAKQQLIERRAQTAMGNDFLVETPPPVTEAASVSTSTHADAMSDYFGALSAAGTPLEEKGARSPRTDTTGSPAPRPMPTSPDPADAADTDLNEDSGARIFSKAANIIRESFEVEGCLFFDVTFGSYRAAISTRHALEKRGGAHGKNSSSPTTSGSEENVFASPVAEKPDSPSDVLAFSTSQASSLNVHNLSHPGEHVTKRFLAKLLRRYPDGKIFNYDADGELQSSDYSEEDASRDFMPGDKRPAATDLSQHNTTGDGADGTIPTMSHIRSASISHRSSRLEEAASISKAFPAARSVAFVPIWDAKRNRWLAGSFIYTLTPTRLFSVEAELSILRAFGKMIAADVHSLEARQADKATADTLGSLSHELRSPLHGIMLSTELLSDTDMSVFQSNAAHTIETCCRTLLDTIDHLLDYSKINSYGSKAQKSSSHMTPRSRMQQRRANAMKKGTAVSSGQQVMHTHIRLDSVLEEVIDSMFAGFNFQYTSIKQLSRSKSVWSDRAAHSQLDGAQALEQLGVGSQAEAQATPVPRLSVRDVSVYISIDPTRNWMFFSQVGALRRIIMNLFGNSLKYTDSGYIHVTLRQDINTGPDAGIGVGGGLFKRSRGQPMVTLVVQDTGRGMTEDFLTHKLFRPFAQEDELASGTGLGLSIVKSTVSQLGGRIQVESKSGVGTIMTVRLPLVPSSEVDSAISLPDDGAYEHGLQELKGLRVRIMGTGTGTGSGQDRKHQGLEVMQDICRRWLHLEVLGEQQAQHLSPDLVLWLDEDALQDSTAPAEELARYPNIVICRDPFVTHLRYRTHESAGQGVFEYITQPVGPRKLVKSMQLAYERWTGLPKLMATATSVRRPAPVRSYSSQGSGISIAALMEKTQLPAVTSAPTVEGKPAPVSDAGVGGVGEEKSRVQSNEQSSLSRAGQGPPPSPQNTPTPRNNDNDGAAATKKILIVDDNHINRKVMSVYLTKLGWAYDVAVNGQEAVDAYVQDPGRFAGIIMDLSMPVMDGLEATRQIRALERTRVRSDDEVPEEGEAVTILALTGLATDAAQQEAFASGVDVFLTKPVRLNMLQETLESRLTGKQS